MICGLDVTVSVVVMVDGGDPCVRKRYAYVLRRLIGRDRTRGRSLDDYNVTPCNNGKKGYRLRALAGSEEDIHMTESLGMDILSDVKAS